MAHRPGQDLHTHLLPPTLPTRNLPKMLLRHDRFRSMHDSLYQSCANFRMLTYL